MSNDLLNIAGLLEGYSSDNLGFQIIKATRSDLGTAWDLSIQAEYKSEVTEKDNQDEQFVILVDRLYNKFSEEPGYKILSASDEGTGRFNITIKRIDKIEKKDSKEE